MLKCILPHTSAHPIILKIACIALIVAGSSDHFSSSIVEQYAVLFSRTFTKKTSLFFFKYEFFEEKVVLEMFFFRTGVSFVIWPAKLCR